MSNWFERNPFWSVFVYSLTIAGGTWVVLTFILGDNKDKLHEKQIDNLNSEISIKDERIRHLEQENYNLRIDNHKYVEWLQSMPQSISFFSKRIKELETNINKKDTVYLIENTTQTLEAREYYFLESPAIKEGQAFIDNKTGAVIGITNIRVDRSADAVINLPGQNEKVLTFVKAGNKWEFTYGGKKYDLIVTEINYISSSFKVILREKK